MTKLTFNNVEMHTITRNGKKYVKGTDIAKALEYSDASKVAAVYRRNKDEFLPSEAVKLTVGLSGNYRTKALYFDIHGARMIALLSKTDKAKEFRRWCLDVLDSVTSSSRSRQDYRRNEVPEQDTAMVSSYLGSIKKGCEHIEAINLSHKHGRRLLSTIVSDLRLHAHMAEHFLKEQPHKQLEQR